MYYKISSCDFVKIKCDNRTFPLVVAHLDFSDTYANGEAFVADLLRISKGMITISSISYRGNEAIPKNKLNEDMIPTSSVIGNENGFKITKSAQNTGEYSGTYDCHLFFNGTLIAYGESSFGWSESYDVSPIFVFCDESYNVLQLSARLCSINVNYLGYTPLQYTYGIDLDFEINELVVWGEPTNTILTNIEDSIEIYSIDPYSQGGDSTTSEMTGDFDDESDDIDFPSLPTLSAVDTGFISIYNPTLQQLKNLATYMWDDSLFSIEGWQKLFADPMDAILALAIVPVNVPDGITSNVIVGNIDTGVTMTKAQSQYVDLDCGTLNVNEYWSAYLDYEPHTKCEIYLPYCGVHQLSVDDIMGKSVHVKYHIDILSGGCIAYVKCGGSVLYEFSGQCATMIPISSQEYGNVIASVVSVAVSVGSMVGSGGATAPLAVPAMANTVLNGGLKPNIEKSGSVSGVAGLLAIQKPYLILTRPKQAHPENQSHYTGYPSFITELLSSLRGYTEIEKIHLENVPCTSDESEEIENLLKGGVIL